jgi:hypothetical protein
MNLAELVRRMAEAGAPPEAIAIALEAVEAAQAAVEARLEAKRDGNRERQRRRRSRVTERDITRDVTRDERDNPSPKKEIPPTPPKEKTTPPALASLGPGNRAGATPRETLLECLSPETADGVLAHRKAMRRPLTGRAAQLLAKGFASTADPNAAADMMIERGWQGFKPEWFDNERRSNGNGKQGKGSIVEAGRRLTARLVAAEREHELQAERGFGEGDDAVRLLPGGLGKRP